MATTSRTSGCRRTQGARAPRHAGSRTRTKPSSPYLRRLTPGAKLLAAAVLLAAKDGEGKTIDLSVLEQTVTSYWNDLLPHQRTYVTEELDSNRSWFPGKEAGCALLLKFCVGGLEKAGYRIAALRVSPAARQLVSHILNEPHDQFAGPVHELVIENIDTGAWQESGPLKLMGYKVGNSGAGTPTRRAILRRAYKAELVPGSDDVKQYIQDWGPPSSPQRLMKITGSITRFMELARNRKADCSGAIADWESDLDWLRRTFG